MNKVRIGDFPQGLVIKKNFKTVSIQSRNYILSVCQFYPIMNKSVTLIFFTIGVYLLLAF